jgi:hypothetical protein
MPFVATLLLAALPTAAPANPAGRWEGAVLIPGRELEAIVDLAQAKDGQWEGSATLPSCGVKGAPLGSLVVKDRTVEFAIKGALGGPEFKGLLTPAGALEGDFRQGGNTARFVLHRTGAPQVEPQPQSTPVAREAEGAWQGDMQFLGNPIHATLTIANRAGRAAAAQFKIVGQREHNLPVDLITQDADLLTLESHELGVSFEGRLRSDQIEGTFVQGAIEVPLVLRRMAAGSP